ncbi:MAG: Spy/CpxP family protein refolding chaperone [Kofleriaceae bacterium]
MTRTRMLFTIVPSLLVGGVLFGSAFGWADAGRDGPGYWPDSSDRLIAQAPPPPPRRPPVPPVPPTPPTPPPGIRVFGSGGSHGVSVTIDGNKIQIDGLKGLVNAKLEGVKQLLRSDPRIPKDLRDKVIARIDKVQAKVDKRMSKLKFDDFDELGEEMEAMGEEIEKAMEGLEKDLEKLGHHWSSDFQHPFGPGKLQFDHPFGPGGFSLDFKGGPDDDDDDDDDHDASADSDYDDDNWGMPPDVDVEADDDDLRDAISDLRDVALQPAQRAAIGKIRTDSDKAVANAKQQLDALSDKLRDALGNPATSDAEIARYVDQISAQEAAIRKARILAWVNARRVLDANQRQRVQDAARKRTQ